MRIFLSLFLASTSVVLAAGCAPDAPIAQDRDGGSDDGGSDDGGSNDGGRDDGGSDGGCESPIECASPPAGCHWEGSDLCTTCGTLVCDEPLCGTDDSGFPVIGRTCGAASDCVVAIHQRDCCGSLSAIGIAASEQSAFDAAEASCRSTYAACECASQPTAADDGTIEDGSAARVECIEGQCRSTFRPAASGTCTPGGSECGAGSSCCYPCGIPGCEYMCEPTCSEGTPGCVDGCLLRP